MNHRDFGDPKWIKILFQAKVKYEEYIIYTLYIGLYCSPFPPKNHQQKGFKRWPYFWLVYAAVILTCFNHAPCDTVLEFWIPAGRQAVSVVIYGFQWPQLPRLGGGRTWDAGIPDLVGTLMIIWKDRFGPFWLVPDEKNHGYRPDEVEWSSWNESVICISKIAKNTCGSKKSPDRCNFLDSKLETASYLSTWGEKLQFDNILP